MAAKRAFSSDRNTSFVCGDARFLPFKSASFEGAFSYSVIQHFSFTDASAAIAEIGRVLTQGGTSMVQMAHAGGLRSTYVRTRRNYMDGGVFRVRYWNLKELRRTFAQAIGNTKLRAEAFGGLGLLLEDWPIVSTKAKFLLAASESMKRASSILPPLIQVADSVYVSATKQ
jgi:SAM-dependent methyltransferase